MPAPALAGLLACCVLKPSRSSIVGGEVGTLPAGCGEVDKVGCGHQVPAC